MDVSRETFKELDEKAQNLVLFDTLNGFIVRQVDLDKSCSERHNKLDDKIKKSGRINKALSAGGGFFGGLVAAATSKFMGV